MLWIVFSFENVTLNLINIIIRTTHKFTAGQRSSLKIEHAGQTGWYRLYRLLLRKTVWNHVVIRNSKSVITSINLNVFLIKRSNLFSFIDSSLYSNELQYCSYRLSENEGVLYIMYSYYKWSYTILLVMLNRLSIKSVLFNKLGRCCTLP